MSVRVTEIFYSIQGESTTVGRPTVFVRLTGCPMRCRYCDTAYAFHGGKKMQIIEIIEEVAKYRCKHVTVTGGEPLAQKNCWSLLNKLCDQGYSASLETGGAVSIEGVDQRVYIVLDVKTPASGEMHNNTLENLELIKKQDALKFVICDRDDYLWSKKFCNEKNLYDKAEVFFSPSAEQLAPTTLAEWILQDQLPARLQIQLHKLLWSNQPGK